jgi:hypothetical protein
MSADTVSPYPTFEPIAERIDALNAQGIETELMPLLGGERDGLVQNVIHGGAVEPARVVFGALEGAMERVEGMTQTILGEKVVTATVSKLGRGECQVDSVDTALTFFGMARSIADRIEDPKEKTRTIRDIATGVMRYTADYSSIEEPTKLADQAQIYFGEAAESAATIASPRLRATELARVAEASAGAIERLAEGVAKAKYQADEGQQGDAQKLFDRFVQQPRRIYRDALASASEVEKPADRLSKRADVVVSMAGSAADIVHASAYISEELTYVAGDEIVSILSAYKNSGEYASLPPAQKSTNLIRFGSELGAVIERQYGDTPQLIDTHQRSSLIYQTANVFKAARDYAQEIPLAGKILSQSGIARGRYTIPSDASYSTLVFAGRVIDADYEIGKEMLVAAFDLARVNDFGTHDSYSRGEVLSVIGQNAAHKGSSVEEAFELFSLGHTLAGIGFPNSQHRTDARQDNAYNAFYYLARTYRQDVALERVDREYVRYMLRFATRADSTTQSAHLRALGRFVEDEGLQRAISAGAEMLSSQEAAAAEPQNDTDRIVRDTLRRR